MKAIMVTPKNESEFQFISELLYKLGVDSSSFSEDDREEIGMIKLFHEVDKNDLVSREEIMKKLLVE